MTFFISILLQLFVKISVSVRIRHAYTEGHVQKIAMVTHAHVSLDSVGPIVKMVRIQCFS